MVKTAYDQAMPSYWKAVSVLAAAMTSGLAWAAQAQQIDCRVDAVSLTVPGDGTTNAGPCTITLTVDGLQNSAVDFNLTFANTGPLVSMANQGTIAVADFATYSNDHAALTVSAGIGALISMRAGRLVNTGAGSQFTNTAGASVTSRVGAALNNDGAGASLTNQAGATAANDGILTSQIRATMPEPGSLALLLLPSSGLLGAAAWRRSVRRAATRARLRAGSLIGPVDRNEVSTKVPCMVPIAPLAVAAHAVLRARDILGCLLLLLITAPLLLVVACLIKVDSRGPLLHRQDRIGLNGRVFTLLKFRSMRVDAEADGPRWAAERDPRVTRVGRVIRGFRIDELPQLLNVLRGEMSLVGPRPERPCFSEQLANVIPHYEKRTGVLPGITGWAQVSHPYGDSVEDARVKLTYDLDYVRNRTPLLDLYILVATVRVVALRIGAR
jgi:lipopolysaccharide/colanic/teichoic acid biosynthesis glycosyltransferase